MCSESFEASRQSGLTNYDGGFDTVCINGRHRQWLAAIAHQFGDEGGRSCSARNRVNRSILQIAQGGPNGERYLVALADRDSHAGQACGSILDGPTVLRVEDFIAFAPSREGNFETSNFFALQRQRILSCQ
jgi:hypothetical protein